MTIFTVTAPGAIAVLGFLFTCLHTRSRQRLGDRLARVNRRLGNLYGPLLTLSAANRISYRTFLASYDLLSPPGPTTSCRSCWREQQTRLRDGQRCLEP